jgi:uncharacterized protein
MKGVIADTGPLYATYDKSDHFHTLAQEQLSAIAQADLAVIVPYPVLLESYSLILKRLGISASLRFLQEINQGADIINLNLEDYQQAQQRLQNFSDQSITLFDASTAILSDRLQLPVWTYDRHFDIMRTKVWRN